jgi:hypothetical protein
MMRILPYFISACLAIGSTSAALDTKSRQSPAASFNWLLNTSQFDDCFSASKLRPLPQVPVKNFDSTFSGKLRQAIDSQIQAPGKGVTIYILEEASLCRDKTTHKIRPLVDDLVMEHVGTLSGIIQDPRIGLAPHATLQYIDTAVETNLEGLSAQQRLVALATTQFDGISKALKRIAALKSSGPIVINLSQAASPMTLVATVNFEKDPNWEGPILPDELQIAARLLKKDAQEKGPIAQARQRYDDLTRKLVAQGIVIVVSAGNDGEIPISFMYNEPSLKFFTDPKNTLQQNWLANQYVTVVGASTETANGVKPAFYSSPNPFLDVLAPEKSPLRPDLVGTSFSAPLISALIALIKQKNPGMTPATIEKRLKAFPLPPASQSSTVFAAYLNALLAPPPVSASTR